MEIVHIIVHNVFNACGAFIGVPNYVGGALTPDLPYLARLGVVNAKIPCLMLIS